MHADAIKIDFICPTVLSINFKSFLCQTCNDSPAIKNQPRLISIANDVWTLEVTDVAIYMASGPYLFPGIGIDASHTVCWGTSSVILV